MLGVTNWEKTLSAIGTFYYVNTARNVSAGYG